MGAWVRGCGESNILVENNQVGVASLQPRRDTRVLVTLPVLDVNDADDAVEDVGARAAGDAVDLEGEGGGEGRARGLDDDAIGGDLGLEFLEGLAQLADEVAADAAVEHLADARDGIGRGQLRVDGQVAELILEEGELVGRVGGFELRDEVEDERRLARAQEARDDGDWYGRHVCVLAGIVSVKCVGKEVREKERKKEKTL